MTQQQTKKPVKPYILGFALILFLCSVSLLVAVAILKGDLVNVYITLGITAAGAFALYPALKEVLRIYKLANHAAKVNLCVLVERGWALPNDALVEQVFGDETIIDEDQTYYSGESVWLYGPVADIQEWIRQVGGTVWVSTNPMMGKWKRETFGADHVNA